MVFLFIGLCLLSYFIGAGLATYGAAKEFKKFSNTSRELLNRAHEIMGEQTKTIHTLLAELEKMKSVRPTFTKVETNENNNLSH